MQTQSWFKRILPNLIAIVAFLLLSAVFAAPALKGDRIAPHDTISFLYMSKEARDHYQQTGEAPGWANNNFGGMPMIMTYQPTNSNWMGTISGMLQMQPDSGLVNPVGYLFICMLGAFVMLRAFKISTLVAGMGAVAYAFTSYIPILIGAGHITKVIDLAFLPAAIGATLLIFRGQYIKGGICYLLFMSFFLSAWHLQIIYYSLFIFVAIGIYFFIKYLKEGKVIVFAKALGTITVATIAIFLSIYSGVVGTNSYAKYSIRGGTSELTINKDSKQQQEDKGGLSKDYAFSWSNGIGETFCAIVPNLYGGASGTDIGENSNFGEALAELGAPANQIAQYTANAPTYSGPQPFLSGPIYFGAIVCFLAILGLFVIKSKFKWLLFGLGLFFAAISWGKNFDVLNYFLFDTLPLFNKFRSPNMALSLTAITFFALAFWGLYELERLAKQDRAKVFLQFKNAAYTSLGLVLLIILGSQFMMDHKAIADEQLAQSFGQHATKLLSALRADRAAMALKDGLRSLVFIAIAVGILWAFLKEKIAAQVAIILVGLASIIDIWGVGKRYLKEEQYLDEFTIEQQYFTPTPAVAQVMKDKDPNFRVLDLSINFTNDAKTSYFVKTVGGYHPAKLRSYQDLLETQVSKLNHSVLNMLNTKYIITQAQQGTPSQLVPNQEALGNAWFVSNLKFTKTADETILAMDAPAISQPKIDTLATGFNPAMEAIVRDNYQSKIETATFQKDANAAIKLITYAPDALSYESNNASEGFAVFSEIYYPENWIATIDGKETEIYPVNYVLRGIKIPAGKHKIDFKYEDPKIKSGYTVQHAGSAAIVILILASIGVLLMNRKKGTTVEVDIDSI